MEDCSDLVRQEIIKEGEVKALCAEAGEILVEEGNVQRVDSPVTMYELENPPPPNGGFGYVYEFENPPPLDDNYDFDRVQVKYYQPQTLFSKFVSCKHLIHESLLCSPPLSEEEIESDQDIPTKTPKSHKKKNEATDNAMSKKEICETNKQHKIPKGEQYVQNRESEVSDLNEIRELLEELINQCLEETTSLSLIGNRTGSIDKSHPSTIESSIPSESAVFCENEKRKMLMEHETLKLKQLEEKHSLETQELKGQLKTKKTGIRL